MTDIYMDQQGSKKKYLVPLLVLLLCAVSLTGAGYAYQSSVTGDGNVVDSDVFTLDGITIEETTAGNDLLITQDYNATGNAVFNYNESGVQFEDDSIYQYVSHISAGLAKSTITVDVTYSQEKDFDTATFTAELVGFKVGDNYYTLENGVELTVTQTGDGRSDAGELTFNINEIITEGTGTTKDVAFGTEDVEIDVELTVVDTDMPAVSASALKAVLNTVTLVYNVTAVTASA